MCGIPHIEVTPAESLPDWSPELLEQAVEQYKLGKRRGPNAIAMQAQVNAVSEEDLKAILKFYASQDGVKVLKMN